MKGLGLTPIKHKKGLGWYVSYLQKKMIFLLACRKLSNELELHFLLKNWAESLLSVENLHNTIFIFSPETSLTS